MLRMTPLVYVWTMTLAEKLGAAYLLASSSAGKKIEVVMYPKHIEVSTASATHRYSAYIPETKDGGEILCQAEFTADDLQRAFAHVLRYPKPSIDISMCIDSGNLMFGYTNGEGKKILLSTPAIPGTLRPLPPADEYTVISLDQLSETGKLKVA